MHYLEEEQLCPWSLPAIKAWGNLLVISVSCPSASISKKDDYCAVFDDKPYYGS
jgi:hypothetical protein